MKKSFVIQQYYEVQAKNHDLEDATLQRMLQAILMDEKVLQSICEYMVRREYSIATQHDDKDLTFAELLIQVSYCFTQDDREWITNLVKEYQKVEVRRQEIEKNNGILTDEDYERIGYFDLDLQVEELQDCFIVVPTGWMVCPDE